MDQTKVETYRSPEATLILLTRWPKVGHCKTRLAKTIGPENAARIQDRLIKHTISVAKELEEKNLVELQLAICGVSSRTAKKWGMRNGLKKVVPQGKGNLGLRMKRQILLAQKSRQPNNNGRSTIIIGSDLPSLCKLDLTKAIECLKRHEIVLGPSADGGYWLIGLTSKLANPVVSWPFTGIDWGTNQVLKQTIQSANSKGINYQLLHMQNDIDKIEDLAPWQG